MSRHRTIPAPAGRAPRRDPRDPAAELARGRRDEDPDKAEREFRQHIEWEEARTRQWHAAAASRSPAKYHGFLGKVLDDAVAGLAECWRSWPRSLPWETWFENQLSAACTQAERFLISVEAVGIVRATLERMEVGAVCDECRGIGTGTYLDYMDREVCFQILQDALDLEEPHWRIRAVEWLIGYAPDPAMTVLPLNRALTNDVPEVRWWAALGLSALAPDTPGLAPLLAEAVRNDWSHNHGVFNLIGAATKALAGLGPDGLAALEDLLQCENPLTRCHAGVALANQARQNRP